VRRKNLGGMRVDLLRHATTGQRGVCKAGQKKEVKDGPGDTTLTGSSRTEKGVVSEMKRRVGDGATEGQRG